MLDHTDVPDAPWILVEGDSKRWARIRVMDETIEAIEAGMRRVGVPVPEPLYGIDQAARRRRPSAASGTGHRASTRRTNMSASRPSHTPRTPQPSASASSAIGT